jgi:putative FmdB family regulatory protein
VEVIKIPVFDFECEHCGLAFDKLVEPDVQIATCPECEGNSYKVFPKKAPSINLKYNPVTDMVDWNGNTTRYWDQYKKDKADGKDVRIPKHDGDG